MSRNAGAPQGWLLIATAWVSAVAVVGIAPVLPQMAAAFAGEPGLDLKLRLIATFPALGVALLAWPYGLLADRIGRRAILIVGLAAYALVGMAPLALSGLNAIVIARAAVGVAEAAVMTCGTALLIDLFQGPALGRWLALQTGIAPLLATGVLVLSGFLGHFGWQAPFLVYGLALVLVPLLLRYTWEPPRRALAGTGDAPSAATRFSWPRQFIAAGVAVFVMIGFMLPIIQLPFLLAEAGMTDAARIGLLAGLVSLATLVGSFMFSRARWPAARQFQFVLAMFCLGCAVIALLGGVAGVVLGAAIVGIGGGFVLPTLVTWTLRNIPSDRRGVAAGLLQSAIFFGQFIAPLVMFALRELLGGTTRAVLAYAGVCLGAMLFAAARTAGPSRKTQSA